MPYNSKWNNIFHTYVAHLNRTCSDHAPPQICCNLRQIGRKGSFRFLDFCTRHPKFLEIVKNYWTQDTEGRPMVIFYAKLKRLKDTLRIWSKQEYGNPENFVKAAEDKILECEYNYEVDPSDVK